MFSMRRVKSKTNLSSHTNTEADFNRPFQSGSAVAGLLDASVVLYMILFSHRLSLISPSSGASGRLFVMIVSFPEHLQLLVFSFRVAFKCAK